MTDRTTSKDQRPQEGLTMPKKKEPDVRPEEQFNRFQEAAKEHEIKKRLPEIEKAFDVLTRAPKSKLGLDGKRTTKKRIS